MVGFFLAGAVRSKGDHHTLAAFMAQGAFCAVGLAALRRADHHQVSLRGAPGCALFSAGDRDGRGQSCGNGSISSLYGFGADVDGQATAKGTAQQFGVLTLRQVVVGIGPSLKLSLLDHVKKGHELTAGDLTRGVWEIP